MRKKTSILSEIMQVEKEMEMLIEGFFEVSPLFTARWRPNIDIYENEKEIVVEVELPGVKKEDVKISLYNERLDIRGIKRGFCGSEENVRFLLMEREYGYFQRSILLPHFYDPSLIRAVFKNGILTISLTKVAEWRENASLEILIE